MKEHDSPMVGLARAPLAALASLVALLAPYGCGSGGNSARTGLVQPANLTALARATSVTLTWQDQSTGEAGYRVERDDGGAAGFVPVVDLAPDATSFADSGLSPSTTYGYRVVAFSAGEVSVASGVLAVTTTNPSLRGMRPATGFTEGFQTVILDGDGFSTGVDSITFNGRFATDIAVLDDASLTCTTPRTSVVGPATVVVNGTSWTSSIVDLYSYFTWPPVLAGAEQVVVTSEAAVPVDLQVEGAEGRRYVLFSRVNPARSIWFARSAGTGSAWSQPVRLNGGSGIPYGARLAVDGRRVCVVWQDLGSLFITVSSDYGATWSGGVRVDAPFGSVFDPVVAVQGDVIHVAFVDKRPTQQLVYYSHSRDGGRTWLPQAIRVNTADGAAAVQLAVSGDLVYVIYGRDITPFEGIYFARSTDGGKTWVERDPRLDLDPMTPRVFQICAEGQNLYVLAEEDGIRQQTSRIALVRSADGGGTWSDKMSLSSGSTLESTPVLACSDGNVYVAWQRSFAGSTLGIYLNRSKDVGATWLVNPIQVRQSPIGLPMAPAICADGRFVFVAWEDRSASSTASTVRLSSSLDYGLTFSAADLDVRYTNLVSPPRVHCVGAEVFVLWGEVEFASRFGLRQRWTIPR